MALNTFANRMLKCRMNLQPLIPGNDLSHHIIVIKAGQIVPQVHIWVAGFLTHNSRVVNDFRNINSFSLKTCFVKYEHGIIPRHLPLFQYTQSGTVSP